MSKRSQPLIIVAAWAVHRSPPTPLLSPPLPSLPSPFRPPPPPSLTLLSSPLAQPPSTGPGLVATDLTLALRPTDKGACNMCCTGSRWCKRLVDADTSLPASSLPLSLPVSLSLSPLSTSLLISSALATARERAGGPRVRVLGQRLSSATLIFFVRRARFIDDEPTRLPGARAT